MINCVSRAKCFIYTISFNPHNEPMTKELLISMLQKGKPKLIGVIQGRTASKQAGL